jgi:thiol-disulfide isomerase/thioredoxin
MKKYVFIAAIVLVFFSFISCSETVIVKDVADTSVTAPPVSGYFKKHVLIEDYTGTWCGNCTRVAHAVDLVVDQTDKAVTVAIHNGNDPYSFDGIAPLKNLILPNSPLALPVSRLNRVTKWTFPEPTNIKEAIDLTGNNSGLGLAMNSSIANGNLNLDVKINFAQANFTNLKLVVYLLEDKLIYRQFNYTNFYNAINPIPDFEHNHVLRNSLTNILGDTISENILVNQSITRNFNLQIPSNISNPNNISFVAFIVGEDNKVINARAAKANENQLFEQNQ